MKLLQKIGLALFVIALCIFTAVLGINNYVLDADHLAISNEYHLAEMETLLNDQNDQSIKYSTSFDYTSKVKDLLHRAQKSLDLKAEAGLPSGISEWDYRMGDWAIKDYVINSTKKASVGPIKDNPWVFLFLTFGLAILGGILYVIPMFMVSSGIKNDGIYHSPMTRGLTLSIRSVVLSLTIIAILVYGFYYLNKDLFWPLVTALIILGITTLVFFSEGHVNKTPAKSASPNVPAWLGLFAGFYFIGFYVLLYWAPQHVNGWVDMVNPVSQSLSGNEASQWFLYGLMYTVIVLVMGIRMIAKYRHNTYQMVRTASVMFFQTGFAFLLPEILVRLNQPWFDFKNIWPLNYSFFFDWNINHLIQSGTLGIFMLVWGIVLTVVGVPVITYFFGKRWYCSWVCGCGGLAETMGDPYRQLSDKSLRAWNFERWIIHGVLVFAVIMTAMVLFTYFTGSQQIWFFDSGVVRSWYGFLIGSAFAGIIGTGFYPLMGNRTWCRFGCPLAAYLGLVQKYKSRFRITTNGGQCISCGNCSTYCEMGIDVRYYAQRGQDIVRSSCVGCGICSAVCPRGVLKLENGPDVQERTSELRTLHIAENEVFMPQ
jgi:polyferredoxin